MEFSCHIWGFSDWRLPEALGTIARLGFRAVDLGTGAHLTPARAGNPKTREATIREFRDDLALYNLEVADLYIRLPRISVDDDAMRRNEVAYFRAMLPFAEALGVGGITLMPGLIHPPADEAALTRTIISLQQMVKAARQAHLPISIEPQPNAMVRTPQQALDMIDVVDGLHLTLDLAYSHAQGYTLNDLKPLLPHTRHIYLRQATTSQIQVPQKMGTLDLKAVMKGLQRADYAGAVGIKLLPVDKPDAEMAIQTVAEVAALRDTLRALRDAQATGA